MRNSIFVNLLLVILFGGCATVRPPDLSRISGSHRVNANYDTAITTASPFRNFNKGLFKAAMRIKNKDLSGLLLIKKMDALYDSTGIRAVQERTYRIVFANEIGLTFFDLGVSAGGFTVFQCFESLNRKALLNILKTDFRLLLRLYPDDPASIYVQEGTGRQVIMIGTKHSMVWETRNQQGDTLLVVSGKSTVADAVTIGYRGYRSGVPGAISIENPVIGLQINLRRISE